MKHFSLIFLILITLNSFSQTEHNIGFTYYDLQTNNSTGNMISTNGDGTISVVWNYSPDANQGPPPFLHRGFGYSYFDGTTVSLPEVVDTGMCGFPNVITTPTGQECIVAHCFNGNQNYIHVSWRAIKGSGTWTRFSPFGNTDFNFPKICGGVNNEYIYMVFQGNYIDVSSIKPPAVFTGGRSSLYFSKSNDGGQTWLTPVLLPLIDSINYMGFLSEAYAIDAIGDTVTISFGDEFTDFGILKSTDGGLNWTKTIIKTHPQPFYNILNDSISDINSDGIADTVYSVAGDSEILIDHSGMCHAWYSGFNYINKISGDNLYTPDYRTDGLYYWNENMGSDSSALIISTIDLNGNGIIDGLGDTVTCDMQWGNYGGGFSQMPSAVITDAGIILLTFQSLNELSDSEQFGQLRKSIYFTDFEPPYDPATINYFLNIVPDVSSGGFGEYQEAVYSSLGKHIFYTGFGFDFFVLYQRDAAPGHALSDTGSCDFANNFNAPSDIILSKIHVIIGSTHTDTQITVQQNSPNPFSDFTSIPINLKAASNIKLFVYDLMGRLKYELPERHYSAGDHTFKLDINLQAGVYLYVLKNDEYSVVKKMIVQE